MLKRSPRKSPIPEKPHRPKRAAAPVGVASAGWLPAGGAGFVAWGEAAERAHREFRSAWRVHQRDMGDDELLRKADAARELFMYTLERAYPAGFWEEMGELQAGKAMDLEKYLAFLEADPFFFRSGYAKSEVIRGLKRAALTAEQMSRLRNVVLSVIDKGFRREFRDYCRLARRVQNAEWLREVEARLLAEDEGRAVRARWVLNACGRG